VFQGNAAVVREQVLVESAQAVAAPGWQQGWSVLVAACQRPAAGVDPQLVDPPVGLVIGDDRDREVDSPGLTVKVENHLLEASGLGDDVVHVLDRRVALREPSVHLG
jgi:hypothetical protein